MRECGSDIVAEAVSPAVKEKQKDKGFERVMTASTLQRTRVTILTVARRTVGAAGGQAVGAAAPAAARNYPPPPPECFSHVSPGMKHSPRHGGRHWFSVSYG
jgi:hypothetical protein